MTTDFQKRLNAYRSAGQVNAIVTPQQAKKQIRRARYQRRYARNPQAPKRRPREIYPVVTSISGGIGYGRGHTRFSFGDLLKLFRVGPPVPTEKPTPKPSKFVLIGTRKGVQFWRMTWKHLNRSKYANGARAQRGA